MIPACVKKVARDIKNLKIQGATHIAIEGLNSLKKIEKDKRMLLECSKFLAETRPVEPLLRNGLRYVLKAVGDGESVGSAVDEYLQLCVDAIEKIIAFGAKRIEDTSKIMTHCHSSIVIDILKHAKQYGKKFEVIACEARPKFQGRITAVELSKAKIPVTFIVDSAANFFINKVDLVLVGCDAITAECDFFNKIGSSAIALCANEAETDFAIATELLKFDPETTFGTIEKIEERDFHEVWSKPPKGVEIRNPAFDIIPAKHIHFVITENGIMQPQGVLSSVKEVYPWIFK